jgi:hypothetical protein
MNAAEQYYLETGRSLEAATESQMFGKPCFKIGDRAFTCFFQDCMVFKMQGEMRARALALPGALLFDPSGKGRAMKEWVHIPFTHKAIWPELAQAACTYVKATA